MADNIKIKVIGAAGIGTALQAVVESLTAPEMRKVYLAVARRIVERAKQNAPRHTGLLRRSISANASKSRFRFRELVASIAWVRLFKGAVRAPHAHLVEFGTAGPRSWNGRTMRFKGQDGKWVSRKTVAAMPPSFFFRRAVNSAGPAAVDFAARRTGEIISGRWTDVRKLT